MFFDRMSWDEYEGWVVEIKLFGLIFQFAIGRRDRLNPTPPTQAEYVETPAWAKRSRG